MERYNTTGLKSPECSVCDEVAEEMWEVLPDEDDRFYAVLHIYGFPADIVPAVNKYNHEHTGPNGNAINITQTCIDALKNELKKRGVE